MEYTWQEAEEGSKSRGSESSLTWLTDLGPRGLKQQRALTRFGCHENAWSHKSGKKSLGTLSKAFLSRNIVNDLIKMFN